MKPKLWFKTAGSPQRNTCADPAWGAADVYKVLRLADGRVFAGKSGEAIAELSNRPAYCATCITVRKEHIWKLVDWYQEPSNPPATLLVTEFCGFGTLQGRIDSTSPNMDRGEILWVVRQMAEALEYLHRQRLFHTDIKPRNILIRGLTPMDVVLADCADVRQVDSQRRLRGTPSYYSPEIVRHRRHYGEGDDVWALGITLLGMVGQWPSLGHTAQELREYPRRCSDHVRRLLALNPWHDLVSLLGGMVAWDLDERLSAKACAGLVRELLAGEREVLPEYDLGIETPQDFTPVTFW